MTVEELAGLRFFEGMPGWALERLARSATKRRLGRGAIVVRQNDEVRAVCYQILPDALSQLIERARGVARNLGVRVGGGEGISTSTLASVGRNLLGGALGRFGGLAAFLTGLIGKNTA